MSAFDGVPSSLFKSLKWSSHFVFALPRGRIFVVGVFIVRLKTFSVVYFQILTGGDLASDPRFLISRWFVEVIVSSIWRHLLNLVVMSAFGCVLSSSFEELKWSSGIFFYLPTAFCYCV